MRDIPTTCRINSTSCRNPGKCTPVFAPARPVAQEKSTESGKLFTSKSISLQKIFFYLQGMFCRSKYSIVLVITFIALLIVSCTPDPPDPPPTTPPPGTPPTALHDSTLMYKFITFNYSLVPDTVYEETFYYDASKRITQVLTRKQDPGGSGGPLSIERDTLTYY